MSPSSRTREQAKDGSTTCRTCDSRARTDLVEPSTGNDKGNTLEGKLSIPARLALHRQGKDTGPFVERFHELWVIRVRRESLDLKSKGWLLTSAVRTR